MADHTRADPTEPMVITGADHRRRLDVFVGCWTADGRTGPASSLPGERLIQRHTFEWLSGEAFLLHTWEGSIGSRRSDGIEIIGYDAPSHSYRLCFFDSDGLARIYQGHMGDGRWTVTGELERATTSINEDGTMMTTSWERRTDQSTWRSLCHVIATKFQ